MFCPKQASHISHPCLKYVHPQSLSRCYVASRERPTIIPHGVPYMTKLLRYFMSEDSIFLQLEHVPGEGHKTRDEPFWREMELEVGVDLCVVPRGSMSQGGHVHKLIGRGHPRRCPFTGSLPVVLRGPR